MAQLRLRVYIPQVYHREPVISRLISQHGLVVNITSALLPNASSQGEFDLELKGTPQQICQGLLYLASLNLKILGKANPAGDGWYY